MKLTITLYPERLNNPDLDIRYVLPDLLKELSEGRLRPDGYDYTAEKAMELFLICDDGLHDPIELAKQLLTGQLVLDNDIVNTADFRYE